MENNTVSSGILSGNTLSSYVLVTGSLTDNLTNTGTISNNSISGATITGTTSFNTSDLVGFPFSELIQIIIHDVVVTSKMSSSSTYVYNPYDSANTMLSVTGNPTGIGARSKGSAVTNSNYLFIYANIFLYDTSFLVNTITNDCVVSATFIHSVFSSRKIKLAW